jgi:hypothetical protein
MKRCFISISFLVLINLFSCSKNTIQPVYVNTQLKQYFNYLPGSYWIFYDSLNNKKDSMYVDQIDTFPPYSVGSNIAETVIYTLGIDTSIGIGLYLANTSCDLRVSFLEYTPSESINYPYYFTNNFPFDTGKEIINSINFNGFYENTFINNIQLGAYSCNDVYRIQYDSSGVADVFYINEDVGFLAILFNNQYAQKHMYLINYKIIK